MSRWSQSGFMRSKSQQPVQIHPQPVHFVHDQGSGPCGCRHDESGGGAGPLCPRRFVERYSLPRLVRVVPQGQQPTSADMANLLGGQLLMYSHYRSGKIEARSQTRMRGSSTLVIPDAYQGWFSVVTERGQVKARCYPTLQRLVTSQVTTFLVVNDLTAYTLNNRLNLADGRRQQYSKTVVRGGQVLKLLAVYQDLGSSGHGSSASSSSSVKSKRLSWPLLNRSQATAEAGNRYAQCLTSLDQVLYIPLTTSGQFYAVASGSSGNSCANPASQDHDTVSKVYQLPRLLRTFPLPVRVCIINSCKPQGSMLLETYRKEEVILTCLLDPPAAGSSPNERFRLVEIDVNSKFYVVRPTKRISDERRLFQSDRVQSALRYCHENWEKWSQQLKVIHHIYPKEVVAPQSDLHHKVQQQAQVQKRQQVLPQPLSPPKQQSKLEQKQNNNRHRKISLGDKKTVKSASFRFSTSYQPEDLRPVVARRVPLPDRPDNSEHQHIYSDVASDAEDSNNTTRHHRPPPSVASSRSYATKISVGDLVDRVFSESGYSFNQELRVPFYRTRLHVGSESEMPYSAVKDRLHQVDDDDGLYAEIGESNIYRSSRYTSYISNKSAASMS